jgi:RNase P/RNase MRP subunit p30
MFTDIAIPKNNEAEFIEIAGKLGIKKLYFLYDFDDYNEEKTAKKSGSINHSGISIETGFLINQKNIDKAAKQSRMIVAKSSGNDRAFIESSKVRVIYGFEEFYKRDHLHQRASGLNHMLCGLARKNNVAVGFSYSSLLNKNPEITSVLMGRMMQNIRLCKKFNTKMIIGAFSSESFDLRAAHDVMSMFSILGIDKIKRY